LLPELLAAGFLHVRDAARAYADALSWFTGTDNVDLDNFCVGDIAQAVEETVERPVDVTYLREEEPGPSYHVDFGKVESQGFTPEQTLESGISDLASKFRTTTNDHSLTTND